MYLSFYERDKVTVISLKILMVCEDCDLNIDVCSNFQSLKTGQLINIFIKDPFGDY